MGDKGSIAGKEEIMYLLLKCLCVSLQSPEVEQTAIESAADIHSIVIGKVFCGLL